MYQVSQDGSFSGTFEIAKVSPDRQQVFGFAKVAKVGDAQHVDLENDVVEASELEGAAYEYVLTSRVGKVMHAGAATADLIESVFVTPEKLVAMGVPADIAKAAVTGWWVGYQVRDADAWAAVVAKRLRAFSIGGRAIRQEVD